MKLGSFEVRILDKATGQLVPETQEGHQLMKHQSQYGVVIINNGRVRAAAKITVDGLEVGDFLLDVNGRSTIERFVKDNGILTFFRAGSAEAQTSGEEHVTADQKGLVQVHFVPEKAPVHRLRTMAMCNDRRGGGFEAMGAGYQTKGMGAGMTGLTGHSTQQFHTVSDIDRDHANAVTISVRLVEDLNPPVRPAPGRIPQPQANPVPAPVG